MSAWRQLEACIRAVPTRLAVIDDHQSTSYAQLGELIDQAADRFVGLGLRAGDRIVIVADPSLEAIVAMFAAWSLDIVTIPMDIEQPTGRFAQVVHTVAPQCIIGGGEDCSLAPIQLDASLLRLRHAGAVVHRPAGDPTHEVAYIIHTSGSTGTPKGIEITHANISAQLAALDGVLSPEPGRMLASTPLSFDPSVLELVWTLTRGWTVVTAPPAVRLDPQRVSELITQHDITHLQITPTIARLWIDQPDALSTLGHVKQLLIGGEALTTNVASALLNALDGGQLVNLYGPSETTVWAFASVIHDSTNITLGQPLPGYHARLVDVESDIGELHIGGPGVGRGYHALEQETLTQFITDTDATRWYRTGDLAQATATGYVFHGRIDHQVKLGGQRIELSGIEAICEQLDGVRSAVVVVQGGDDDPQLVAFLEAEPGTTVNDDIVVHHLRAHLPKGQQPHVRWVPHIALTASGKADRRALIARYPDTASVDESPGSLATRNGETTRSTSVGDHVEAAWRRVLRRDIPSLDSDFFELGGHSVLAARMVARLNRELGVRIGLASCAQSPRLGDFIDVVHQALIDGPIPQPSLVTLRPGPDPVVFIHGRDGNIVDLRFLSTGVPAYRGAVALQARGLDGLMPPHHRLSDMGSDYIAELTASHIVPSVLVGYSGGGLTALEMAAQLEATGAAVRLVVMLDTEAPDLPRPTRTQRAVRRLEPGVVPFATFVHQWQRDRRQRRRGQLTDLERDLEGLVDIGSVADIVYRNAIVPPIHAPVLLVRAATKTRPWDLGWSRHIGGRFAVEDVPGDHVTMLRPPQVAHVARAIRIATVHADGDVAHLVAAR
jgi:amino acid adenylation domain-containing protein